MPLLPSTRGLIGETRLRRMPRGALLVNASRGGVVDVYESEPPPADSPLLALPAPVADRVLFTPHIAGVAYEAAQALYTRAWDNVRRVLGNGAG